MDYAQWQYFQVSLSSALAIYVFLTVRRRQIGIIQAPYVWVVIGYGIVSPLSNLIRWSTNDFVSLNTIAASDYDQASLVWCASLILTVGVYVWRLESEKRVSTISNERLAIPNRANSYTIGLIALTVLYLLNPVRGNDFGTLEPRSMNDLSVGGLLVGAILFNVIATFAAILLRYSTWSGLLATSAVAWAYSQSGSKGIVAVYLLYMVVNILRQPRQGLWRHLAKPLALVVLLSIVIALPAAVERRSGETVSLAAALQAAGGRFTQQDVFSVLWAFPDWRQSFARTYVEGNLLGFVPGVLFPDKPFNPAYQITNLFFGGAGPISAASPSLFGALLIVFQDWLYWPILLLATSLICKMDWLLCRSQRGEKSRFDYEWLYISSLVALFETSFVVASYQLIITFAWWYLLTRGSRIHEVITQGANSQMAKPLQRSGVSEAQG